MNEANLPTGTVTFLLTDVEGSTRLWEDHGDAMGRAVERHVEIVERAVTDHGGMLVKSKGEGDSTFSVFARPTDAVAAAAELQRAMGAEAWPGAIDLRTRAAIHTGQAELRDGDYYGTEVNRCARLRAVAHGGQTVCSQTTADLVADAMPAGTGLRPLGTHRLRDLERPEQISQVSRAEFAEEYPPLRSLDAFRHNLPTQRTSFVGRDAELNEVRGLFDTSRLVTLTGVGGCGKTRLALQLAAEEVDRFPDGVFFVELAPVSDPAVVSATVAVAVGMPGSALGSGSGRSVRVDLLDFLSERDAFIVLDNCEHLVDVSAGLCDDLLSRCRALTILATSREALEVEGEQTYSVPSLEVPTDDDPSSAESVRLFCDRAASVRPGFDASGEATASIAEICRRLDGIPLAIELAAAQVAHLSPHQIAERLGDRFRLLTGGRRRVQRQQTLGAMLDWSYDLLDEDERVLLRRLAAFPGTFTLEAAESVCAEGLGRPVVALLRSLVGKSLVLAESGTQDLRYRLLETVRLYGEDKLLAANESDSIRTRHRDHYLNWIESFPPEIGMFGRASDVLAEQHNLRAALVWSGDEGHRDVVGRLVTRGLALWGASGGAHEGVRWLVVALEDPDALTPGLLRACLAARSWLDNVLMDGNSMLAHAERALGVEGVGDGVEDWTSMAHGVLAIGHSYAARLGDGSDVDRTEMHGRQAVEIASKASNEARASALMAFGMAISNLGDYERAASVLAEGLRSAEHLLVDTGIFQLIAARRSIILYLLGRHEAALHDARLAAEISPSLAQLDMAWPLWANTPLGLALAANGLWTEARDHLEQVLGELRDTKIPGFLGEGFVVLGAIAAMKKDWERASRLMGTAQRENPSRSPPTFALYRDTIVAIREHLDRELRHRCRAEGSSMPVDEAIAYGLECVVAD